MWAGARVCVCVRVYVCAFVCFPLACCCADVYMRACVCPMLRLSLAPKSRNSVRLRLRHNSSTALVHAFQSHALNRLPFFDACPDGCCTLHSLLSTRNYRTRSAQQ